MRKPFLAAAALVGGLVAIFYLAFAQERVVPLQPLAEAPRPPVRADPTSTHTTLSGRRPVERDRSNAARRARNALARRHAEALDAWRAGTLPLRAAEAVEMDLHVARHRIGEISDRELHTLLATLYAREVERLEALHAAGGAGKPHLEKARLYLARERHLAGVADTDYEARRMKLLADTKARFERLAHLKRGSREHYDLEYETLEMEFPALD